MLARDDVDPGRIICFGRSIGGAVALNLTREAGGGRGGVAACIVENTFLSIGKMVDVVFPFLVPVKARRSDRLLLPFCSNLLL